MFTIILFATIVASLVYVAVRTYRDLNKKDNFMWFTFSCYFTLVFTTLLVSSIFQHYGILK